MWTVAKNAFWKWQDGAPRLAAGLAFYTIFSLAPTFIIVVAIAALVLGESTAESAVVESLRTYLGPTGAQMIVEVGQKANQEASGGLVMGLGILVVVLGSTVAFAALQEALNTVWGMPSRPGLKGILYQRFVAFLMVIAIGALLLLSVAASTVLSFAIDTYSQAFPENPLLPGNDFLLRWTNALLSFGVVLLGFAMLYKYVPDAEIHWRDVWVGAAITALLFTLGKSLIGWYLGTSALQSVYGAAASLVAVLLWIYYSAQVFLFGAVWTETYAHRFGSGIRSSLSRPEPMAERPPLTIVRPKK